MGSGIIFNNGGGGGGQNPTTDYIPLNNGTSNFVDSNLLNFIDNKLSSIFSNGDEFGISVNFSTNRLFLGDFNSITSGIFINVDNISEFITTAYQGSDIGLRLDFANNVYFLGDFNSVSATNSSFIIDNNNGTISTQGYATANGILLDFSTNQYFLGDYNGTGNTSHISIKDSGKDIILSTNGGTITNICDLLVFDGALTTGSASGNSGQHLQVTINGTPYVIQLLNP